MIRLTNVAMSFDKQEKLLVDVNFAVKKGDLLVIVGPSGSGKSVLMKMVGGLLTPTKGEVCLFGENLNLASKKARAAILAKVGMLFQKNALFDSLSVGENLAFPLRETGQWSEREINAKVDEYLEQVDLSGCKKQFPDEISGGMQKRVGIARALVLEPEIILYDDPTAGLDPITSKLIVELILNCKRRFGTTVVAITNDMHRAFQMATHMGMILDHTFLDMGAVNEPRSVVRDPRVHMFIKGVSN